MVVCCLPFNAGANRDPEVWSSGRVRNATLHRSLDLASGSEFATDYIREDLSWNLVSVFANKHLDNNSWPQPLCPSTFIVRFPLFRHTKQETTLFGSCVPIVMKLNNKRVRHWHSSFVLVRSFLPPNRHLKHSEHGSSAAQIQFTTHTGSGPVLMLLPPSSTVHLAILFGSQWSSQQCPSLGTSAIVECLRHYRKRVNAAAVQ